MALVELADPPEGATSTELIVRAAETARAAGHTVRGAEHSLFNCVRKSSFIRPLGRSVWQVTDIGRRTWQSGLPTPYGGLVKTMNAMMAQQAASDTEGGK